MSLVLGFAVAVVSGVRPLGGVVLLVGGIWCAIQLYRLAGLWRTVVVGLVYTAAFALSHPLGDVIGSWPSVFLVALVTGLVAYGIVPRSAASA